MKYLDQDSQVIELIMDAGRPFSIRTDNKCHYYKERIIKKTDIESVISKIGKFGQDNRAGIDGTLHRISCIRNRYNEIIGLTIRIGRTVEGAADIIADLIALDKNILLIGPPGSSKTTKLREVARIIADEMDQRVVVVDTSNEIAGDGDIPHAAIGNSRRMQVRSPMDQHSVMIEAVENHMPEVIIIDEIGTEEEVKAARTIAERGVRLIATAHGRTLENLMINPSLNDLIGGIESVTLGDEEAKRRGTQKTVLERRTFPVFDVAVEIQNRNCILVHLSVEESIDAMLHGADPECELREIDEEGKVTISDPVSEEELAQKLRVFAFGGISKNRLKKTIKEFSLPFLAESKVDEADIVLTLRGYSSDCDVMKQAKFHDIPVVISRSDDPAQIKKALECL